MNFLSFCTRSDPQVHRVHAYIRACYNIFVTSSQQYALPSAGMHTRNVQDVLAAQGDRTKHAGSTTAPSMQACNSHRRSRIHSSLGLVLRQCFPKLKQVVDLLRNPAASARTQLELQWEGTSSGTLQSHKRFVCWMKRPETKGSVQSEENKASRLTGRRGTHHPQTK
jgi:hypothetical protein